MTPPEPVEIDLAGERLGLLPDRAVWWGDRGTVFVADLHLGKPASFRAAGAVVPEAVTHADLGRLTVLLASTGARSLVILGDLAHDGVAWRARTLDAFAAWRRGHAGVEIVLVRGNHDRRAADPPACLEIRVVEPGWRIGPITMHHEPPEGEPVVGVGAGAGGVAALCGHLHPAVVLRGRRKAGGVRSACFWLRGSLLVLPAFGTFTGCARVSPARADRVFPVGPGGVVEAGARAAAR